MNYILTFFMSIAIVVKFLCVSDNVLVFLSLLSAFLFPWAVLPEIKYLI